MFYLMSKPAVGHVNTIPFIFEKNTSFTIVFIPEPNVLIYKYKGIETICTQEMCK